jgi:hypothetical protein
MTACVPRGHALAVSVRSKIAPPFMAMWAGMPILPTSCLFSMVAYSGIGRQVTPMPELPAQGRR